MTIREVHLTNESNRLQKEFTMTNKDQAVKEGNAKHSMLSVSMKTWKDWLTEGSFYVHAIVYMLVRIAVNVTMSVQPFYLILVTGFAQTKENPTPLAIALAPLISYICSLIFSLFLYKRMVNKYKNRFVPLFFSVVVITMGSIPYLFLNDEASVRWLVFPLSGIQGIGLACMLNTATSLISDVVGKDEQSAAFVYGAYSFFDKVANGILIFVITSVWIDNAQALKWCIAVIPPFCALGAFGFTYLGKVLYSEKMARFSSVQHNN